MKRKMTSVLALCTIAGLSGPALADCQDELAQLTGEPGMEVEGGISKDGSLAPLEDPDASADASGSVDGADSTSDTGASDSGSDSSSDTDLSAQAEDMNSDAAEGDGEVVKDGDTAPLETDTSSVATSGQDAAAQQDGSGDDSATASSDASSDSEMSQEAKDAIETAKAALEAGDEKACMDAVEEARNS
ncbi:hypothetical protein [Roseovarius atlanticus]|uniref:hypothetical protein n=1 Tax=Roseovarius atlanticus TaxID=1641875 RepID=UPI001C97BD89|nr:hypothetical protein [Roseovarius atlanticus]MBY5988042.1 hypothetical protein [Roseovarius atlanticus]MBY6123433.1 hypothetical protein [Roseovarius atlanticus]MBY6147928.1 hypothetical protein [Roseovarius atlanticus]